MLVPSFLVSFSLFLALPAQAHAGIIASIRDFFAIPSAVVIEGAESLFTASIRAPEAVLPSLEASGGTGGFFGGEDDGVQILQLIEGSAILAPLNPLGLSPQGITPPAGQIFIYTIRSGDTLSSIADAFGVTVNTILWANNLSDPRSLRIGDRILILPVSGVRHEIKKGDTLETIVKKYKASVEDIIRFNALATDEVLKPGDTLIIPNGELPYSAPISPSGGGSRVSASLPNYSGYYARPITGGRRSRGLHGFNGLDLASSCGLPVFASAEGVVLLVRASGWNGGYGRYIVISHPNSTQTLYAHLKEIYVNAGEGVSQNQAIGTIGSSGNSTGCHVHFEVRGARNPF